MSIVEKYPTLNIEDADISKAVKVNEVWRNGVWNLPDPLDNVIEAAWNEVRRHTVIEGQEDRIVWKLTSSKKYTIASA